METLRSESFVGTAPASGPCLFGVPMPPRAFGFEAGWFPFAVPTDADRPVSWASGVVAGENGLDERRSRRTGRGARSGRSVVAAKTDRHRAIAA